MEKERVKIKKLAKSTMSVDKKIIDSLKKENDNLKKKLDDEKKNQLVEFDIEEKRM